jgi:histidinol-phosphate/aromatic aminotransferase/cobyric acid decarboxylase-like protein/GNAT superfamily N-acetyltransferase
MDPAKVACGMQEESDMKTTMNSTRAVQDARIRLAEADAEERLAIQRARHEVYAAELGQYETTPDGVLRDAEGLACTYLVASVRGEMVGFVGITPPGSSRFSVDRYLRREDIPFPFDDGLHEIRALTVLRSSRGTSVAAALMYAAFRWVETRGGTRILAIGRREVLDMYLRVGLARVGRTFTCGAVTYELVQTEVAHLAGVLAGFDAPLRRLAARVDWALDMPFRRPSDCYHGGAFFDAIGNTFDDLGRRELVINADVLDAWFPPAPSVDEALREHAEWIMRTSPPTHAEGLTQTIARVRGVDPASVLAGGGSSALIFLAFRQWLSPSSRVLILDPMYGEYAHVLERVIGCRVERWTLERAEGYRLDTGRLARKLDEGFDLFVWVNPNNPTGLHVAREEVEEVLRSVPSHTRVWVDEAYLEYAGPGQSLESFAAGSRHTVVCKSLSKAYALSGMRVGYLCGPSGLLEQLRRWTPPWSVSLPAQIAAVHALRAQDYYVGRYQETRLLRADLETGLRSLGIDEVIPGVANFIQFHLPPDGPTAADVAAACRGEGLFVRELGSMGAKLGPHALRIAVKDAATNRRMLEIVSDALADRPVTLPTSPRERAS